MVREVLQRQRPISCGQRVFGCEQDVRLGLVERLADDSTADIEVVDQRDLAAAVLERALELG